jgi:hypothetical protein
MVSRLHMEAVLALLKREKDKKAKAKANAQEVECDAPGRDDEDMAILGIAFPYQTGTAAPDDIAGVDL